MTTSPDSPIKNVSRSGRTTWVTRKMIISSISRENEAPAREHRSRAPANRRFYGKSPAIDLYKRLDYRKVGEVILCKGRLFCREKAVFRK